MFVSRAVVFYSPLYIVGAGFLLDFIREVFFHVLPKFNIKVVFLELELVHRSIEAVSVSELGELTC